MSRLRDFVELNPRITELRQLPDDKLVTFLPMSAVSEEGRIEDYQQRQLGEVRKGFTAFRRDDLLLAKITPCMENGKVTRTDKLATEFGLASTEFHVLRPGTEVDAGWLFHYLWRPLFRESASRNMTGSAGQRRLPAEWLAERPFEPPSIEDQRAQAEHLDAVEDIRRDHLRALTLIQDFVSASFLEVFGDPVENPRGHPQKKLSQVSQVRGGLQVSGKREGSREVGYLRVANVHRDTLKLDEIKTMRVSDAELTRTKLESGDVLVVEGHGNPEELGRSAVWRGELEEMIHQNHLIRIRPDSTSVTSEFVSAYINSEAGRRQMLQAGKTTSGLNTISTTQVANLDILVPPMPLQQRFVEALDEVRKLKETLKRSLAVTEALYASLSHRYFGAP